MARYELTRRRSRTSQEFDRIRRQRLLTEYATRQSVNPWISVYEALPNPDPVLRKTSQRIEILHEIKREPHVSACSKSRKAGVKRRLWKIEPGNATADSVRLIEAIFQDLRVRNVIGEMLDGWGYGYKPLEILWAREGDLYIPTAVSGKPPEWFEFGYDDNELRKFVASTWKSERVEDKKFLLARYEAEYNNPYGEAQYSLAFWPVTFKKGGIKFWAQFLESFGLPHAIGKIPRNATKDEKDQLLGALQLLIQNAVATIPEDASVELLEVKAGTAASDLFKIHSSYHDGEISKCILGHGAAADSTPGKLGGDDPAMSVRSDIVDDDSHMVMECFDELIRYIFELNSTLGEVRPTFVLYDENDVDSDRADRDFKLMNSKRVVLKKPYFLRCYDFREDEIDIVETPAPEEPAPEPGTETPEFEAPTGDDAQASVDDMLTGISDQDTQALVAPMVQPVLDLIDRSNSYDEVRQGLLRLYPELNTEQIGKTLERAMLLANVQGAAAAASEAGE